MPAAAQQSTDIAAVRFLIARMGVTPEQLLSTAAVAAPMPTFADYADRVSGAVTSGTRRVYGTYWRRVNTDPVAAGRRSTKPHVAGSSGTGRDQAI